MSSRSCSTFFFPKETLLSFIRTHGTLITLYCFLIFSKWWISYKLIAVHEAKHKIRCNAVLPGMTATDAVKERLSEDFRALFVKHIPLCRMGLPEEIASAVVYFASDDSAYTTGQILTVSGGFGLATPVYGDLKDKLNRR